MRLTEIRQLSSLTSQEATFVFESIGASFGRIVHQSIEGPFDVFQIQTVKHIIPQLKAWAIEMMNKMHMMRNFNPDEDHKYKTLHKILNNTEEAAKSLLAHTINKKLGIQSTSPASFDIVNTTPATKPTSTQSKQMDDLLADLQF